jgi:hypothetical protein
MFLTFLCPSQIFHYQVDESGLTFLVLADDQLSWRVAFTCIYDIRNQFLSICGDSWKGASECSLNDIFSRIIRDKLVLLSGSSIIVISHL